ncbi:MAG: hypothetical protein ACI8WB_004054 [Phenylobacterium sp.]|jgi:hypothetical protein
MDTFLANIATFPTAIFTTFMLVVAGFWLMAMLGLMDIEGLDFDIDFDAEGLSGLSALAVALGLTGVPLTIVLSLLGLISWLICYYSVHFGLSLIDSQAGIIHTAAGAGIALFSLIVALPITGQVIRPLRKLFSKLNSDTSSKSLLGTTCTIRTTRVDQEFGEAECMFNDASLIIKVRADIPNDFARGDQAVIIDHNVENQNYHIVSPTEFNH